MLEDLFSRLRMVLESIGNEVVVDAFFFGLFVASGLYFWSLLCLSLGNANIFNDLGKKVARRIYEDSKQRIEESALTVVEVGRRDGEGAAYHFDGLPKE